MHMLRFARRFRSAIVFFMLAVFSSDPYMAQELNNRFHMRVGKGLSGVEEYKISKTAGGHRLEDLIRLEGESGPVELRLEQTVDDSGKLIHYTLQGTVSGQPEKVDAWIEGQQIW